jgi:hypothetical protein
MLILAVTVAVPTFLFATPASASCQTNPDVGDWCKVRDAVFEVSCRHKVGYYLGWCD